jgi:hypothetical protein
VVSRYKASEFMAELRQPVGLITQRSVVQIHPPQPTPLFGFNGLSRLQQLAR